jgi:hypothetical protein
MEETTKRSQLSFCRVLAAIAGSVAGLLFLLASQTFGRPQFGTTSGFLVTPSSAVLLVVSSNGRGRKRKPASNVQWSISPAIAELHQQDGEVLIEGKQEVAPS